MNEVPPLLQLRADVPRVHPALLEVGRIVDARAPTEGWRDGSELLRGRGALSRSAVKPNLQNIPLRTELGRALRDVFRRPVPDVDYASIERRITVRIFRRLSHQWFKEAVASKPAP